jgi:L-ascorbate metabolism protein UlaG (beta-lactamase superfamily)
MRIVRTFHLCEPAATVPPGQVRAVYLGVSTILFDDGRAGIVTDGFFSRPGLARVIV